MGKKSLSINHGRWLITKVGRRVVTKVATVLKNPKTPRLLLSWLRVAVAITRFFDK
jgi:hypothetical protein